MDRKIIGSGMRPAVMPSYSMRPAVEPPSNSRQRAPLKFNY